MSFSETKDIKEGLFHPFRVQFRLKFLILRIFGYSQRYWSRIK